MTWYQDKEYQLMCEKAEKIQEIARRNPPTTGAYLRHLGQSSVCVDEHGRFFLNDRESRIYLPSQEDLQEIYCKEKNCTWVDFLLDFYKWLYLTNSPQESITKTHILQAIAKKWDSEVQLKLAFVEDNLYGKKWNPDKKEWEDEAGFWEKQFIRDHE